MDIWVTFANGKISVAPEIVRVRRGTGVTWRFRTRRVAYRRLRWMIYFGDGHPFARPLEVGVFRGAKLDIPVDTQPRDGEHAGASPAGIADEPGHYKYGVRLEDPIDDTELGDEDPYLIVF